MRLDTKNIIIGLLLIIVIILYFKSCGKSKSDEYKGLYEAAQDTLQQTRNELGEQVSSIALLSASNDKLFLKMKTNDSTIIALQNVVKDYKGKLKAATVLGTSTNDTGSSETTIKWDTIRDESGTSVAAVYETEWDEKWSVGSIRATKDSISRDIKIRNDFEITIGEEKQGWFKKKKSLVTITNKNPNTITQELRTFTVEPKKRRISIGLGAAYGFDIIGLKPTIVVGPTVHIPIISW